MRFLRREHLPRVASKARLTEVLYFFMTQWFLCTAISSSCSRRPGFLFYFFLTCFRFAISCPSPLLFALRIRLREFFWPRASVQIPCPLFQYSRVNKRNDNMRLRVLFCFVCLTVIVQVFLRAFTDILPSAPAPVLTPAC